MTLRDKIRKGLVTFYTVASLCGLAGLGGSGYYVASVEKPKSYEQIESLESQIKLNLVSRCDDAETLETCVNKQKEISDQYWDLVSSPQVIRELKKYHLENQKHYNFGILGLAFSLIIFGGGATGIILGDRKSRDEIYNDIIQSD